MAGVPGLLEAGRVTTPAWHPETTDDVALLRAELDACRVEIVRLRNVIARARHKLGDRWGHAEAPYEPVALEAIAVLGEAGP